MYFDAGPRLSSLAMTKDGRPSRINDIRLFVGERPGHRYVEGQEEAVAFGRRIAYFLNGEGFSLGAYPALYVLFTRSLEPGEVRVTDFGGDWWQRYTDVGVAQGFLNDRDAYQTIANGIVAALKAVRPDLESMINEAAETVRTYGDEFRFLVRSRETKHFVVEVSFVLSVSPKPSLLYVSLTDRSTGAFLEAPPIEMPIYFEAFGLASSIRVNTNRVELSPGKSIFAALSSLRHGGPIGADLTEFVPCKRPRFSKLVKPRA